MAATLEVTATVVKGLLQRGRAALGADRLASAASRPLDDHDQQLAERFAVAFCADDIATLLGLLTDDAWLAMPPAPHRYAGRAAIGAFLQASADWRDGRRFRLLPTPANHQYGFGCYLGEDDAGGGTHPEAAELLRPNGVIVLTTGPSGIAMITRFLDPLLHRRFGLPDQLRRS